MVYIFKEDDLIWSIFKLRYLLFKEVQEILKEYEISIGQWIILSYIYQKEGTNQKNITEKLKKDRGEISRRLNNLENKGLIEKKHSNHDKREFLLYLTPKGNKLYKQSSILIDKFSKKLKDNYEYNEIKEFKNSINKMFLFLEK